MLWGVFTEAGNIEKDSRCNEERYKRWSTITHEGECYASEWNNIEIHSYVDEHLHEYEDRDTECGIFCEYIFHGTSNGDSSIHDCCIQRKEDTGTKKSKLLDNHWKYEVPLNFRKVAKFLNRFPESESKKSSTSDRKESLFCLIDFSIIISLFEEWLIGIEKVIDTFWNIVQWTSSRTCEFSKRIYGECSQYADKKRNKEISTISTCNKIHGYHDGGYDENRSKIRLKSKEEKDREGNEKKWNKSLSKIRKLWSFFLDKISKKEDESNLSKFNRLQGW